MTETVTPRQTIAAALALGDTATYEACGTDNLSGMSMRQAVRLVEAARAAGHTID